MTRDLSDSSLSKINAVDPGLRLSAVIAFLGRITPDIRLIKVRMEDKTILLEVVIWPGRLEFIEEDIWEAETEIVADFLDAKIQRRIVESAKPIKVEAPISNGWVYCAKE